MNLQDILQIIDAMNREDATCIRNRAMSRISEIVAGDSHQYAIRRECRGIYRYATQVRGMGGRQFMAVDLHHCDLLRVRDKAWAEKLVAVWGAEDTAATYTIVPVPKA